MYGFSFFFNQVDTVKTNNRLIMSSELASFTTHLKLPSSSLEETLFPSDTPYHPRPLLGDRFPSGLTIFFK